MYQTFAVLFVGLLGGTIAFLQWRTAHQKVLLDLFERRLKIHEDVNAAILEFLGSEGNLVPSKIRVRLHQSSLSSRFLFGKEVAAYIETLSPQVREIADLRRKIESSKLSPADQEAISTALILQESELEGWRDPWTTLCAPYLRMDQKKVRTPVEWLRDKNVIR